MIALMQCDMINVQTNFQEMNMRKIFISVFAVGIVLGTQIVSAAPFEGVTMLEFTAPERCPPCKRMLPIVNELKKEGVNVKPLMADAPENWAVMNKYKVNALPTFVFVDGDGVEIPSTRVEGAAPKSDLTKSLSYAEGFIKQRDAQKPKPSTTPAKPPASVTPLPTIPKSTVPSGSPASWDTSLFTEPYKCTLSGPAGKRVYTCTNGTRSFSVREDDPARKDFFKALLGMPKSSELRGVPGTTQYRILPKLVVRPPVTGPTDLDTLPPLPPLSPAPINPGWIPVPSPAIPNPSILITKPPTASVDEIEYKEGVGWFFTFTDEGGVKHKGLLSQADFNKMMAAEIAMGRTPLDIISSLITGVLPPPSELPKPDVPKPKKYKYEVLKVKEDGSNYMVTIQRCTLDDSGEVVSCTALPPVSMPRTVMTAGGKSFTLSKEEVGRMALEWQKEEDAPKAPETKSPDSSASSPFKVIDETPSSKPTKPALKPDPFAEPESPAEAAQRKALEARRKVNDQLIEQMKRDEALRQERLRKLELGK